MESAWKIGGSYVEACNCDAICPCRRIGGVAGGRSTHGICQGVLSWLIEEGRAEGVDLAGLAVAIAFHYDDDEPGSPWSWHLYLDGRASAGQRDALEAVFTGRLGGDALTHFPWAWKESRLLGVHAVELEVEHVRRRQRLRVRDEVRLTIGGPHGGDGSAVTCGIPGHDRSGEELDTEELAVDAPGLGFEHAGVCGYAATFAYAG